jgi:methionine synthase reductase
VRSSTARSEKECVKQQVHGSDFMYVSANGPFVPLRITAARRMSSSDSNKAVYWLQLGASDTARSKHAEALWSLLSRVSVGDAVALRVPNEVSDVTAIIEHCGAQEGDLLTNEAGHPFGLHICTPCTVRDCLTYMVDLNNITAAVLRVLASHASDAAEQSKLQVFASQQGAQQFRMQVTDQKLSVADILTTVAPSSRPNIRALIAALSPFTPRYYSLSNDPFSDVISSHPTVVLEPCSTVSPGSVTDLTQRFSEMQLESMKKDLEECKLEFIFSVVRGVSPPPHRRNIAGLCTTHLERLIADYQTNPGREVLVPAFATPTHEFKLPPSFSDVSKCPPVILIAAGTGVSPWRSFLQRRETLLRTSGVLPAATAPWWLFFGCRVAQKEDIIHDAIEHWRRDGVLAQALVACSQDTHADGAWYGGRYVQDDVYENRKEIRRLLVDAGAYIYVCGDARGMVRDVHRVLVDVISDDGRVMSDAEARAYLTEMMNTGRYQRESWTQL